MTLNKYNEAMNRIKVDENMRSRIMSRLEAEAGNGMQTGADAGKVVSIESKKNNVYRFRQFAKVAAVLAVMIAGFGAASLVLGRFGANKTMESASMSDSMVETASEYAYEETAEATEETAAAEYEEEATYAAEESADEAYDAEPATEAAAAVQDAANDLAGNFKEELNGSAKSAEGPIEGAIWQADKYDTAKELSDASGIDIEDIASIKEKADSATYIYLSSSDIAEIQYQVDDDQISLRKAKSSTGVDLTGNYEIYEDKETVTVDDITCDVEGSGDIFYQATWSDGTYNYSFFDLDGRSLSEIEEILREIISNK